MLLRALNSAGARRRGLTLVELLLALGLFALVAVGLLRFLDGTLSILRNADAEAELLAERTALFDWLIRDLENLSAGSEGDLLIDWEVFDVDGDGLAGRPWPRVRLIREARAEEFERLGLAPVGEEFGPRRRPLIEICWAVLPRANGQASQTEPGRRGDGVLLRGERLHDAPGRSFFDPAFFDSAGRPGAGLDELATGILSLNVLAAAETSVIHEKWSPGVAMEEAAIAWDGRALGRPQLERHPFNERHRFLPAAGASPSAEVLLPRRLRIELELEREADTRSRPALRAPADPESEFLVVTRPERLPSEAGAMVLVGEEWMQITSLREQRAFVKRGLRGTRIAGHRAGTPIQFGRPFSREIVLPLSGGGWGS